MKTKFRFNWTNWTFGIWWHTKTPKTWGINLGPAIFTYRDKKVKPTTNLGPMHQDCWTILKDPVDLTKIKPTGISNKEGKHYLTYPIKGKSLADEDLLLDYRITKPKED